MAFPDDPLDVEVGLYLPDVAAGWRVVAGRILEPSGREFIAAGVNGGAPLALGQFGSSAGEYVAYGLEGFPQFTLTTDIWPGDTNVHSSAEVFPGGHINGGRYWSHETSNWADIPDRVYALTGQRSASATALGIAEPADHWHSPLYRMVCYLRSGALTWEAGVTADETVPEYVKRIQELVALGLVVAVEDHDMTSTNTVLPPALVSDPMIAVTGVSDGPVRDLLKLIDAVADAFPDQSDNVWFCLPNEPYTTGRSTDYDNFIVTLCRRLRGKGFQGIISLPLARYSQALRELGEGGYDTLVDTLTTTHGITDYVWEWHNYGKRWTSGGVSSIGTYAETDADLAACRANGHAVWMAEYGQATPVGTSSTGDDTADREAVKIMATGTYGTPLGVKHKHICPTWWAIADHTFDRSYSLTYGEANKGNENGPDPNTTGANKGTYPMWDVTTGALATEWLTPGGRAHWDLAHNIWQGTAQRASAWVNAVTVGNGVLHRDRIQINHGRSNWSNRADPGRALFSLGNRDGRWSPDYSAGAYAGHLRRNIPCRVGVGRGEIHLRPTDVGADLASTPDIAGAGGGGGSPTAPAYASVTSDAETTATTTHTFSLPATVNTGDRLLLIVSAGHDTLTASADLDDWTLVTTGNLYEPWHEFQLWEIEASSSTIATALAGSTVVFTTTTAAKSSSQVIRTTGARSGGSGTAWAFSVDTATTFSSAPNPPSLTAPWGSDVHRWYTIAIYGSGTDTVSTYPSGYTSIADTTTATQLPIATAHRTTTAATEDPGAYALTGDENWRCITFVYRPIEDAGDDGVLDISGDIDMRIEFEAEKDPVDIGEGGRRWRLAHKSSGADGWSWDLYADAGTIYTSFTWWNSSGGGAIVGAPLPLTYQHEHVALRLTLDVDNGASGHTITFYTSDDGTLSGGWTTVPTPATISGTSSIKTNDAPLRIGGNPGDATHVPFPGRIFGFDLYDGIGGTLVASPRFNARSVGDTSWTDSAGRVWTVGTGGRISNMLWRFHGEVASLPVRWNVDGSDVWAPVEAAGLFRRLRQGNRPIESAIRRGIIRSATSLVQYWPLEEQGGFVTRFGAAVGTAAITTSGGVPDTGANDDFLASDSLPTLGAAALSVVVDDYTATGAWQVRWLQSVPDDFTGDNFHFMRVETTDIVWEVAYRDDSGGQLQVYGYRGLTTVYSSGWLGFTVTGQAYRMTFSVRQNGSNVDVVIVGQDQDAPAAGGFTLTNAVAGSAGKVNRIRINKDADVGTWAFGHLTLQSAVTASTELFTELNAYSGEKAASRIKRLCVEEGLAHRIEGDPADTESMGPQRPGTLMDLLQECADTDLGILHESRESVAIAYRTRASMLDQPVIIDLDYSAGEVARSPELDRDDQDFANDITVRNWNRSTARAVLDDGSVLSISEPPTGAGRYDDVYVVNAVDSRLQALANTRLALTTVDEPRCSRLALALHHAALAGDSALASTILDSSLGDRIRVSNNLTVALGTATIDQVVQGTRETLTSFTHEIDCLTTPNSPWTTAGGSGGSVEPPAASHSVTFRSQQTLSTPGTPDHVLTALGYTSATPITRADLDGILDDWVAGTGGTTRNVTTEAGWTSAMAAALPGDLIRVTSGIDANLNARGSRYSISGSNLTASPAGGLPGLPIIVTCADGVYVDDNNTSSNESCLDLANCQHVWAVGFNVRDSQFGIRAQNWGGSDGFPAYIAYCQVENTGHAGLTVQGWFQLITSSGGTPPSGTGNEWGFSQYCVIEENTIDGVGVINDVFGEAIYLGYGGSPGWISHAKDVWVRGNRCTDWTSDGLDVKPGCHRIYITDNEIYTGHAESGAPMSILYVANTIDGRPAAFAFDPQIWIEGNRVYDSDLTNVDASSAHIMGYIGLSGIRIANNVMWGKPETATHPMWRARNEKGTNAATALTEFRNDPTWVINNTFWGDDSFENAGYGNPFVGPFPGTITFDLRNNIVDQASPADGEVDASSADFIATVPAIGVAGDAEWSTYGNGSAFDLALTSSLIGEGESIADIDLLIPQDISQRDIPATPNPGAFQPHPANT